MSVSFARAVRDKLRTYGVTVHEYAGWESRGNGQTSNYQGGLMHHTASSYGMAYSGLVNGRPDLSGPLCNSAGNYDGSITMIAAHPANHAGASGGRSMGPLPTTRSFNKLVWGHEIVYPGDKPMTNAQYRSMVILGKVLIEVLGKSSAEWIRGHGETSITGKWDPGYAPSKMINMAQVRTDINNFSAGGDNFLSALTPEEQRFLFNRISGILRQRWYTVNDKGVVSEATANTPGARAATVLDSLDGNFLVSRITDLTNKVNELEQQLGQFSQPTVDIDELAIANAVAEQINTTGIFTEDQLKAAVESATVNAIKQQWSK